MREIKFRGQRVDNGEWVYGDLFREMSTKHPQTIIRVCIVEFRPDLMLVSGAPDNNQWWTDVNEESVGEFTGLHDKNGKEIYEGDIIKVDGYKEKMSVVYSAPTFCMQNKISGNWMIDNVCRLEIIGNIYEHPHLLS